MDEVKVKVAARDGLLALAVLMMKLQKLGDLPSEEESVLVGMAIEKLGDLLDGEEPAE